MFFFEVLNAPCFFFLHILASFKIIIYKYNGILQNNLIFLDFKILILLWIRNKFKSFKNNCLPYIKSVFFFIEVIVIPYKK